MKIESPKEYRTVELGYGPSRADGLDLSPLEWLVIDEDCGDGTCLLITKNIVDGAAFHREDDDSEPVFDDFNLADFDIIKYLNREFPERFHLQEELLQPVEYGSAEENRISLLSEKQLIKYFPMRSSRCCRITNYARCRMETLAQWWLLDFPSQWGFCSSVREDGTLDDTCPAYFLLGVRPVIRVRKETLLEPQEIPEASVTETDCPDIRKVISEYRETQETILTGLKNSTIRKDLMGKCLSVRDQYGWRYRKEFCEAGIFLNEMEVWEFALEDPLSAVFTALQMLKLGSGWLRGRYLRCVDDYGIPQNWKPDRELYSMTLGYAFGISGGKKENDSTPLTDFEEDCEKLVSLSGIVTLADYLCEVYPEDEELREKQEKYRLRLRSRIIAFLCHKVKKIELIGRDSFCGYYADVALAAEQALGKELPAEPLFSVKYNYTEEFDDAEGARFTCLSHPGDHEGICREAEQLVFESAGNVEIQTLRTGELPLRNDTRFLFETGLLQGSLIILAVSEKFFDEDNMVRRLVVPLAEQKKLPILGLLFDRGLEEKFRKMCPGKPYFYAGNDGKGPINPRLLMRLFMDSAGGIR